MSFSIKQEVRFLTKLLIFHWLLRKNGKSCCRRSCGTPFLVMYSTKFLCQPGWLRMRGRFRKLLFIASIVPSNFV
ncbi:hypothetical protein OESDEN_05712 [Oesophagostomum dentatum]|uniref:Uncharacterized protein n=1 Tax=Oesophagostomum dentatum TaxID=61180 RepID=A0A0B1TE12_OESDE|nr:hypothetical protein OESDEN_05712 [Oesophagostomum dentatum]